MAYQAPVANVRTFFWNTQGRPLTTFYKSVEFSDENSPYNYNGLGVVEKQNVLRR